jgi:hypothetical protein
MTTEPVGVPEPRGVVAIELSADMSVSLFAPGVDASVLVVMSMGSS